MSDPCGYSGTPLVRKLGIKAESLVLMVGAPAGFDLGELPDGATVQTRRAGRASKPRKSGSATTSSWSSARTSPRSSAGSLLEGHPRPLVALWVAWPKKSSRVPTDLDDNVVRGHGLAQGLVDVKVCAIDAVWSGQKFVYRLSDRPSLSRTQA